MGKGSRGRVAWKRKRQRKSRKLKRSQINIMRKRMQERWRKAHEKSVDVAEPAAPAKAIPKKAEPREISAEAKARDNQRLLDLTETIKGWRISETWRKQELRDEAMKVLGSIENANAAYRRKTALMRCAEAGFRPGVKYLVEERGADPGARGRVGTALDYALAMRERGYRYVDGVILYLRAVERDSQGSPNLDRMFALGLQEGQARNGTRG